MNQKQKEYALKRVESLWKDKQIDLNEKYRIESSFITNHEAIEKVREGKVKLKPKAYFRSKQYLDTNVRAIFDFSEYENKAGHKVGFDLALQDLKLKTESIKDLIMLGDAEEAIALIKELESYTI